MRWLYNFWLLVFLGGLLNVAAQTKSSLEAKKQKLRSEMAKINRLLSVGKKKENIALNERARLDKIIAVRTKAIEAFGEDIDSLESQMRKTTKQHEMTSKALEAMRSTYAEYLRTIYKNQSTQTELLFLLSSDGFYQAIARYQYLKQAAKHRKQQVEDILQKDRELIALSEELDRQKQLKEQAFKVVEEERKKLNKDRVAQNNIAKKIQRNKRRYTKLLKAKQKEEQKIDKEIEKLIAKNAKFKLTPATKALSNSFTKNKGKLPWPVSTALVVRRFGKGIPHETVKGLRITSNGIHIATDKGSIVRSIFKGKVIAVAVSSNGVKNVLVQHGSYVSVYGNLHPVSVAKGDALDLQQEIGRVHTNATTQKTILKFQIWKNKNIQNPQKWLMKL